MTIKMKPTVMNSASRWVGGRQKGVFLPVELRQYKFKGIAVCWAGGGGFSKAFASAAPAHCLTIRFLRFYRFASIFIDFRRF